LIDLHRLARIFFRFILATAAICLTRHELRASDQTFNITYLGEAKNPSLTLPLTYGDVWAENGYIYVGTDINGGGMNIFSLANSGVPTFLKKYPGDQFEDVEVWDGVGYFSSDTDSTGTGVDIVDLSIPFDPILLSRFDETDCNAVGCGFGKVHTLSVAKTADDRSFLYTTDNAYTDQVRIVDVTSCVKTAVCNPQLAASVDMGLNPNERGQDNSIYSHEVVVRNDRMYVASKNNGNNTGDGWVNIYDVHDPANPVLLKKFLSGGRTHTALPSADGKLLITAEEHPTSVSNPTNVKIYDISMISSPNDPDSPVLLSTLNSINVGIDAYSPHHPHLHGNLLFLPWYEAGLQVFNISDPAHPVRVGSFDTFPGTSNNYNGNWGVDLSMGLKRVMLSDRTRGLIVVDASGVVATGDYDQNMVVNDTDYSVWRATFGTGTSGLHTAAFADGSYNGTVDAADYVLWRKHLGETGPNHPGSAAGTAAVPEPSALVLLMIGLGAMCAQRGAR
jgi:hypothetical protein